MRNKILGVSATALVLFLAACGGAQPENNVAADGLNATANMEELPKAEPVTNVAGEEPMVETSRPERAATKPTPAEPAPAKPKPDPTTAKPASEPAAEPTAPASDCPPEHHAAGHC